MLKRSAISWAVTFFLLCRWVNIACSRSMRFTDRHFNRSLHPGAMFLEQADELFHGNGAIHASPYDIFSFIKRDLSRSAAYIAKVGVGHFAGAVHDAAHYRDLHALQVMGDRPDPGGSLLQVEKCPAAAGTGDVFRPRDPRPGCLKNREGSIV